MPIARLSLLLKRTHDQSSLFSELSFSFCAKFFNLGIGLLREDISKGIAAVVSVGGIFTDFIGEFAKDDISINLVEISAYVLQNMTSCLWGFTIDYSVYSTVVEMKLDVFNNVQDN